MNLFEQIGSIYSELLDPLHPAWFTEIVLRDDSDGQGPYIEKWEYSQPLPEGMKVGK